MSQTSDQLAGEASRQAVTSRRIVIATADTLKPQMAGPAIRAWQVALALSLDGHDVRLVTTSECLLSHDRFRVEHVSSQDGVRMLEQWCEIFFFQGNVLDDYPFLQRSQKIIVVDLYDPFHIEQLEQSREHAPELRRLITANANADANKQCLRGDFFLCASEKQRDLWLGQLAAVGRLNTVTYDADNTLRSLIDVAPFGISPVPPLRTGRAIKGVVPGIGEDDVVLLWGGGIYNWFDPLTLIRAVSVLRENGYDTVRLFFLGMQHPHPHVPEMRMSYAARQLSEELGLTDVAVFFNEQWVEYDARVNYLLDADIGVSNHLDHVETAFSFRTRMLDYLWAGLPMACTDGDVFAGYVDEHGLGVTAPAGDVDALAAGIVRLLTDTEFAERCRAHVAEFAVAFHWNRVLAPLVDFCRDPRRAPDLLDPEASGRLVRAAARQHRAPSSTFAKDFRIARDHLRTGGPGQLAMKAASRVVHLSRGER